MAPTARRAGRATTLISAHKTRDVTCFKTRDVTCFTRNRQFGFTLLELMVALAIIAIAATLVVPAITSNESRVLQAQVRQAESVLNYARRMAVVKSAPATATFRYEGPDNPATDRREGNGPDREGAANRRGADWHSDEVELLFQQTLDRRPRAREEVEITFFPQGGSTGGILTLRLEDRRARIRVDPITGRFTTRYDDEDFD